MGKDEGKKGSGKEGRRYGAEGREAEQRIQRETMSRRSKETTSH